jgi:cyclophilin family peptidyl-prolyl cis-trans isomerase
LEKAKTKLPLPRDIEAYISLQKLIDIVEKKTTAIPSFGRHGIDWAGASQISPQAKLEVSTSKGKFTMLLLPNDAPGTVAEIAKLAKEGFYNGKNFHRVVPSFVAQGGCPRGDGFGGLPYTIRSEFAPLRYQEGYVGVASAGKDTESCQWFITHTYTPHLDGRYTIFAKVISGMDVVNTLDIADSIEDIQFVQ